MPGSLTRCRKAASVPFVNITRTDLLQESCHAASESFVNLSTGQIRFQSDDFLQLLNYAKTYGKTIEETRRDFISEQELVRDGEIALLGSYIYDVDSYINLIQIFETPISVTGFPTPAKNSPVVIPDMIYGVLEDSEYKKEAWEFITYLLSEYPDSSGEKSLIASDRSSSLISSRGLFTHKQKMEEQIKSSISSGILTEENADRFRSVMENLQTLSNEDQKISEILSEEAASFFAGQKTDTQTAEAIQNRVQDLLNERSG